MCRSCLRFFVPTRTWQLRCGIGEPTTIVEDGFDLVSPQETFQIPHGARSLRENMTILVATLNTRATWRTDRRTISTVFNRHSYRAGICTAWIVGRDGREACYRKGVFRTAILKRWRASEHLGTAQAPHGSAAELREDTGIRLMRPLSATGQSCDGLPAAGCLPKSASSSSTWRTPFALCYPVKSEAQPKSGAGGSAPLSRAQ